MLYKSAADTTARLAKGTAAQLLQMNSGATAPQWSSVSGDATIAAGGAVTIADPVKLTCTTTNITATEIVGTSAGDLGETNGTTLVAGTAGKVIVPVLLLIDYTFATAAYTTDVNLTLIYANAGVQQTISSVQNSNATFTNAASAKQTIIPASTNGVISGNVVAANVALKASAGITNPGTAAGTAKLTLCYHLLTAP